jgi:hypothetical protein
MKHRVMTLAVATLAAGTFVSGQTKDAGQVLADARKALGGDKLAAVTTVSAEGRSLRAGPDGNSRESEFELSLALPDKYLMRSVMAAMGNMSIYRNSGFNGGQVIEEIDRPPNLAGGGNVVIRIAGPGGQAMDPEKMTPEQKAEADKARLVANKKEFARITLGMFAASPAAYPLTFSYEGEAESPDGKADVIGVKGEGGFDVRLFIDQQTHLPLMLSWMDKEPLVMTMGGPGGPGGPGGNTFVAGGGGGAAVTQRWESAGGTPPSKEEMDKRMKEIEARRQEAEARRRTVEYRVFYGDYQAVSGVMVPHRIQRSIDGKPSEELIFDTVKVNPKIDAKKFQPVSR